MTNPHRHSGFLEDLFSGKNVIVEVKAVSQPAPIHEAQLLACLKLSNLKLGLLINFNTLRVVDGIKRLVNGL